MHLHVVTGGIRRCSGFHYSLAKYMHVVMFTVRLTSRLLFVDIGCLTCVDPGCVVVGFMVCLSSWPLSLLFQTNARLFYCTGTAYHLNAVDTD